jgi:hypothetical protein
MRSVVLGFRVTPAERRTLERAADREALPVRAWARRLLLLAAKSDTGRIGGVKIRTRLVHWRSILCGPLLEILGVAYAILGLASFVRAEFLPTRGGPLIGFIPTWPFTTWLIIGLGLVLVVALEGSYRVVSGVERNAGLEVEELAELRAEGVQPYAAQVKDATALGSWIAARQGGRNGCFRCWVRGLA